jgi:phosphate transport system substrate-binding protein
VSPARVALLAVVAACLACDTGSDRGAYDVARPPVVLHGVGATASRALFAKWGEQYALVDPSTTVVYDAAGSGAGVRAALDSTADFGVSDSPLSDADSAAHRDVVHLPAAVEAIALVYSLAGLAPTRLQATEDVVADLFAGHIAWWDDAALAALNPGVKLPHVAVRVVYRGDQSGSSFLLTDWLSRTTKRWHDPPTRSLTLAVGVAAQKEDGVLQRLGGTDGALGYVSAVTAMAQHLPTLAVRNASGRFVTPTLEGMRAAAATADLGGDLRAHAVAAPGDLAYPICSFTFVLVHAAGNGPDRRALARFLWWATHDGQSVAPPLGFGALPGELQLRDEGVLRSLRSGGDPAL